jgi:hypothetical protein
MKFKTGDKVSFLNEKRDGVITRIMGNKMVMVAIEDGFEIPVIESDLVLTTFIPEEEPEPLYDDESENESEEFPERTVLYKPGKSAFRQGLYLSFVPENENSVAGKNTYVYLINHTIFDVLFSYALPLENQFVCADFDRIDTESALLLRSISSDEFDNWKGFSFQSIFFIKDSTQQQPPLQTEIKIHPVKFYKEENYTLNDLIQKNALTVSLNSKKPESSDTWTEDQWKNTKVEKHSGLKIVGHIKHLNVKSEFPEKHLVDKDTAEVDLHIEELTEDFSAKSNHELLQIQMNYFTRMLDLAVTSGIKKIVFIHGIGSGHLKSSICEKIQNDYPYLKIQDAQFSKYGRGASEVIIQKAG